MSCVFVSLFDKKQTENRSCSRKSHPVEVLSFNEDKLPGAYLDKTRTYNIPLSAVILHALLLCINPIYTISFTTRASNSYYYLVVVSRLLWGDVGPSQDNLFSVIKIHLERAGNAVWRKRRL